MKAMRLVLAVIVVILLECSVGWSAQDVIKISLDAKDTTATEVFESIAKQSKEKIILETSVKGKINASLKDSNLEAALDAICKSGKFEWRKVYVETDSKMIDQPDRFAATLRMISGLNFPDVVIAASSKKKSAISVTNPKAIKAAEESLIKDLGMIRVYLISNDSAAAAKALEKDKKDASSKAVDDYIDSQKKQMDSFMNMTPEEREQALLATLNMMDQVGSGYMSNMMETVVNTNPDLLKQMQARQMQMLFDMSPESRRAMVKMNMNASSLLTPEQQKILAEDAQAVMEELKSAAEN